MNGQSSFRRITSLSAIAAGVLSLSSIAVLMLMVDFNVDLLYDQGRLLSLGTRAAGIMRWGEFLGLLGFYLLLAPVALYLWDWLRPRSPGLVSVFTAFGLANIFLGALGGALRGTVLPPLVSAYAGAAAGQQEPLAVVFGAISDLIFTGIGSLEAIAAGVWWLGIGLVLRGDRPTLGAATMILGAGILVGGAGTFLDIEPLTALQALYFLVPFWAIWMGMVIAREAASGERSMQAATAG